MGSLDTEKRVAIVTGAVSGIGLALTHQLISESWRVAAFDIDEAGGKALKAELGESELLFVRCDVTSYEQYAAAFQATFDKWGHIDAFCHNAGVIDQGSLYIYSHRGKTEIPPKPNLACTSICFTGLMYGTQLAIHFMRQNPIPGGNIVATGSGVGVHQNESSPEYCGAKAAIHAFVKSSAAVLKLKEDITINCVVPGMVATRNIPEPMRVSFKGYMTPVEEIIAAFMTFLNDRSLNGELLECSVDRRSFLPEAAYSDGERLKHSLTVYDGIFSYIHGEKSGVPGAIQ